MERAVRKQSFNIDCTVQNQVYDLYTCPANARADVIFLTVTNHVSSTNISIYWYDASKASTVVLAEAKNFAANETSTYNSGFTIVLEAGDKIQIKPSSNPTPHVDAICTVLETFVPI